MTVLFPKYDGGTPLWELLTIQIKIGQRPSLNTGNKDGGMRTIKADSIYIMPGPDRNPVVGSWS